MRTTAGKSYIAGAATSKTCLYCGKWNPNLKVSDKIFTSGNRVYGQVCPRVPNSAIPWKVAKCDKKLRIEQERKKKKDLEEIFDDCAEECNK